MATLATLLTGRPVLTLPGSASVLEAARAMDALHVGSILIVDDLGRARGIFTERDLMSRVVVPGRDPKSARLEDVMTRELFVGRPEDAIDAVRRDLQRRHIRHLPVVAPDGKPIAMLSLRNLLHFDLEKREHELEVLTEYLHGGSSAG